MAPGLIFFALSSVALTFVLIKVFLAIEAKNWPSADGIILDSFIFKGENHGRIYKPKITYKYHVNGKDFVSENLDFSGKWYKSKKKVDLLIEQYPPGKKILVYYKEGDPKVAVLEPKLKFEQILCLIGCLVLLVPSFIVILR